MSLAEISTYSQHVPLLVGLYVYYKIDFDIGLLLFIIILSLFSFTEILNTLAQSLKWYNTSFMNANTLISGFGFLLLFKSTKLLNVSLYNLLILFLFIGCSIIVYFEKPSNLFLFRNEICFTFPIDLPFNPSVNIFNAKFTILVNSILMFTAASSLVQMVNKEIENLFFQPVFWIATSILIFFSSSLVIYSLLFISMYYPEYAPPTEFWDIHSILNIICNLLYTYVFICLVRIHNLSQLHLRHSL